MYAVEQSQPTQQEEGEQDQQKTREPPQQNTPTVGEKQKVVLGKRKKGPKKNDAHEKIVKKDQRGETRIQRRESPNVTKNTTQESSEKTITDINQQPSEETDDTVEDTTYKMLPLGLDHESNSDDEVLAQAEKERQVVQRSPKTPVERGQLSVLKHEKQHKSPKQHTSARTPRLCNLCQSMQR
ncbi:hypothetical protein Cgig2_027108 [Carnegiea gigantea]|uniref:Uncharacterized protein n=1 Tax=Carnegiea gigantea TaxID=171969 RepID=A0A9Q1GJ58_9CARY|nr:hypothetical protein Cgig2_027108 [Carnegiea gigantea]